MRRLMPTAKTTLHPAYDRPRKSLRFGPRLDDPHQNRSTRVRTKNGYRTARRHIMAHTPAASAYSSQIAQNRILHLLDGSRVDRLWIAGLHVNWETGSPDGGTVSKTGHHTHCSAFVAAMAKRAGIYILRPPEHGQLHLANAQAEWLTGQGASRGWYRLVSETTAQEAADGGRFVVASYNSGRESVAGHIAVVRPRQSGSHALSGPGRSGDRAG